MKVIDSNGNIYGSIREAARGIGCCHTHASRAFREGHIYTQKNTGITLSPYGMEFVSETNKAKKPAKPHREDPLLAKLKTRYSDEELRQIAEGKGIAKNSIDYPDIHLRGEHHRILVMSDTHIGSVYSPAEWHSIVNDFANGQDVECILHCGDLVDGLKIGRAGTQIYELSDIGFDAQLNKAVEIFSQYTKPVYIISGNHDAYYNEFAGANIVKTFAEKLDNVTYLGHDQAEIEIGGAIIRLFHGGGGSAYALSYRLQKIVESINGGHKPNILLAGHVHKFCYIFERNIHAISVPCMQAQTSFMLANKLAAHTGFLLLDFDTVNGNVANLSCQYFPFYA